MSVLDALYGAVDDDTRTFDCCDTTFEVHAEGFRAARGVAAATRVARDLERQLNAFDPDSDVAALAREGTVTNEHVAALVRRAREYEDRTNGVFTVRHGRTERAVKTYIREGGSVPEADGDAATVSVDGDVVTASRPLDLNGIAKGYLVDRAHEALAAPGRRGYVNGGGDIAGPTGGAVAIESPWGGDPLRVLDTDWAVATSGEYRRRRGGVDHIYRATADGVAVGAENTLVTVVARRDCTEADVLATTCAALHPDDARALIADWPGAEAFLVHDGVFHETEGFDAHLA
ncbi:MAG: FAD:protein FMN transferase [Haloferacaceae archaeon]